MPNTQCQKIIEYCKRNGSITSLEAVYNLGVIRLGARIAEMVRNPNLDIKSVWENGLDRDEKPCRYKRYYIEVNNDADNT